jgi:hypothetical protein
MTIILIFIHYIIGDYTSRKIKKSKKINAYLDFFFKSSLGFSINSIVLFFVAASHFFYLSTFLIIYSVFFFHWATKYNKLGIIFRTNMPEKKRKSIDWISIIFPVALLLSILSLSLKPPFAWDETMYHLPIANFYVQNHGLSLNEYIRFPLFPQSIELFYGLGLLLKSDIFARQIGSIPFFLISMGFLGISEQIFKNQIAGLFMIFFLLTINSANSAIGIGYVDLSLSLFVFAMVLSTCFYFNDKNDKKYWIIHSIFFASTSISIKYFGLIAVFINGLLIFLFKHFKYFYLFTFGVLILGSGWYLRNFLLSSNPFHPIGSDLFGFFIWNKDDLISANSEQSIHGVSKVFYNIPYSLFRAKATFLIISVVVSIYALLIREKNIFVKYISYFFILYLFFWFYVTQVNRFLSPIWALGIFLGILGCSLYLKNFFNKSPTLNYHSNKIKFFIILAILFSLLKNFHWYSKEEWNSKLNEQPGYIIFTKLNSMNIKNKHIVQIGLENAIYYSNDILIGEWYGYGRYSQFLDCQNNCKLINPKEMVKKLNLFNAKYLAVNYKRFSIDITEYKKYFNEIEITNDSVLFSIKE